MNSINPSNKITIRPSKIPNAGRGVFATKDIQKGELIERCPAVPFSRDDPSNADKGILERCCFYFGGSRNVKSRLAIYTQTFPEGHGFRGHIRKNAGSQRTRSLR